MKQASIQSVDDLVSGAKYKTRTVSENCHFGVSYLSYLAKLKE